MILALDRGSAHGTPRMMGGTGPADAAIDTLVRSLAAEIGPRGVRVVGIWTAGLPEAFTKRTFQNLSGAPRVVGAARATRPTDRTI